MTAGTMARGGKRKGFGGRGGRDNKRVRGEGGERVDNRVKDANGEWKYENMKTYRNEKFEAFYKAQGIVPDAEWETFIKTMQAQLPVTFRVNPLAPDAGTARKAMVTAVWSKPFVMGEKDTRLSGSSPSCVPMPP